MDNNNPNPPNAQQDTPMTEAEHLAEQQLWAEIDAFNAAATQNTQKGCLPRLKPHPPGHPKCPVDRDGNRRVKRRAFSYRTVKTDGIFVSRKFYDDETLGEGEKEKEKDKEEEKKEEEKKEEDDEPSKKTCGDPTKPDFISPVLGNIEIAVQIGKSLDSNDILNLYSISRSFHETIKPYLLSTVQSWIGHRCPLAGRIFPFRIYRSKLISDPAERTWDAEYTSPQKKKPQKTEEEKNKDKDKPTLFPREEGEIRIVPGLRYLQLVQIRDRCCREIIAMMARNGHRLPKTMYATLLRLWVLMDVSTSLHRRALLRSEEMWPETDVYNAQFFFVKLSLLFNDPVFGPSTNELVHLMLGQQGLYPLWQLLTRRRYTKILDVMELKTRYNLVPRVRTFEEEEKDRKAGKKRYVNGVPIEEVGRMHLEGWGAGTERHLMRPDELIPLEAVERGINLRRHLRQMVRWGYVDQGTGENLVPSEDELYISDEEERLAHVDSTYHWKKRHALKKRWDTLTPEQQQEIKAEDEDDHLRVLAWANGETGRSDDESSGYDSESYDINDEIDRGIIIPHEEPGKPAPLAVPVAEDTDGWHDYVNKILFGAAQAVDSDDMLRVQSTRDHVRRIARRQKTNIISWHAWLQTPGVRERLEAVLVASTTYGTGELVTPEYLEAYNAAAAEINNDDDNNDNNQGGTDEDYDGDVDMEA